MPLTRVIFANHNYQDRLLSAMRYGLGEYVEKMPE